MNDGWTEALREHFVMAAYEPDRWYASVHPDIVARGTDDPWVSIREPFRGCFMWSWCARGRRLWREGNAASGRS